jgi:hypothetical protein
MLQLSSLTKQAFVEERDDSATTSFSGFSSDGDGRDVPLHSASAGSFRSFVKSANASLQKRCNTLGSSINQNIQQSSAILDCVGDKIATLRDTSLSMNKNKDQKGIFSSQSTTSWGSIGENVSTFTASKKEQVAPIFNRGSLMNARNGFVGHRTSPEEDSFNYQLMSDE